MTQWLASGLGFGVGLVLGVSVGFWLGGSGDSGLKFLAWTVTAVWGVSMVVDMVPSVAYSPPPPIHGIMLAVVGIVSGVKIVRGAGEATP